MWYSTDMDLNQLRSFVSRGLSAKEANDEIMRDIEANPPTGEVDKHGNAYPDNWCGHEVPSVLFDLDENGRCSTCRSGE